MKGVQICCADGNYTRLIKGAETIPPREGHPCLKLTLPTPIKACSGLPPYSLRPCRAHNNKASRTCEAFAPQTGQNSNHILEELKFLAAI